jgi:serine/threonine-protein kinase HipA
MRKALVYSRSRLAGELLEISPDEYLFRYTDEYFNDVSAPAVSLTLTKRQQEYHAKTLFPFFYNMLSEGSNRALQSQLLKIDENDNFGLLLATAQCDTLGIVTVKPVV